MTPRLWALIALFALPVLALPHAARADASLHIAGAAGASQTVRDFEALGFAPELRAGVGFGDQRGEVKLDLAFAWLDQLGELDEMTPVFGLHVTLDTPKGTYSIGLENGVGEGSGEALLGYIAGGLRSGPIDPIDVVLGFDVWARVGRSPESDPALMIGLNVSVEWQFRPW